VDNFFEIKRKFKKFLKIKKIKKEIKNKKKTGADT